MPRRLVTVDGIVQGVGFRPHVFHLAERLGLSGFVRNDGGRVVIEVEGDEAALEHFMIELTHAAPEHAAVHRLQAEPAIERQQRGFSILSSERRTCGPVLIAADIATCDKCLVELHDPRDRRFSYPFLNCTHCGPRFTIIMEPPYDRLRTTMTGFEMCADCQREYTNPHDRRFHAQPIACRACGPQISVCDSQGITLPAHEPLQRVAEILRQGGIVAIKGIGGFHLACDARREEAVLQLRHRKARDAKPLAVMVRDLNMARQMCVVSEQEAELLVASAAPIVIVRKRGSCVAQSVAPGCPDLGIMLPYTPLHHLLLQRLETMPLVMTSGNASEEPMVYEDSSSFTSLRSIADAFLTHDRPIHIGCDDSVVRVVDGRKLFVRRSRGYAPMPISVPWDCSTSILAVGGQMKATFALGRHQQAILSHHIGDLGRYRTYEKYVEAVAHYEKLFAFTPELIVHDLHPDYATTHYAQQRKPPHLLAVQHHHAHFASCLVEHGLNGPAIGVIFDGTGFGTDGTIWGGEFLIGDFSGFRRCAHLRYVPMAGGEQAIRQPWRMALAHALDAGLDEEELLASIPQLSRDQVRQMLAKGIHSPLTSSAGRLFDAVAAIIGVRSDVDFDGQAAMELEWLASLESVSGTYPFDVTASAHNPSLAPCLEIDTRPLLAAIAADLRAKRPVASIARQFHSTLAEAITETCRRLRQTTGLDLVALSGGVFMNGLLLRETVERLGRHGFQVYSQQQVPPNDGGLCLGQLAIAASTYGRDNATSS